MKKLIVYGNLVSEYFGWGRRKRLQVPINKPMNIQVRFYACATFEGVYVAAAAGGTTPTTSAARSTTGRK